MHDQVGGPGDFGTGFLSLVLGHAAEHPDAPALRDDYEALSYLELSERVRDAASGLSELGVGPGDRVALLLPNSAAMLVIAFACLWVGAAFVPLSLDDPPARLQRIVADCRPALVIVRGDGGTEAHSELDRLLGAAPRASVEDVLASGRRTPPIERDLGRDAYLIYTSGTTGEPKGVRVPDRALRAAVVEAARCEGLDRSVRALVASPFHFDGAYGTALPPLAAGGFVLIPRREDLLFLKRFFSAALEEGITHSGSSPSYLRMLLSSPHLPTLAEGRLTTFGLGGEECMARDVAALWEVLPHLRVFNRYGPTETTIEVTTYEVTREDVAGGRIPLGVPHNGVSFTIVSDTGLVLEAPGEVGELYIGGDQLMRGYWGDDELTARVLNDNIVAGETWYKTGDQVWRDDGGRYFYAGRSDDVVKRSGVRVSLTEIALAMRRIEGVSGASCVFIKGSDGPRIAAFVEARKGPAPAELFEALGAYLPKAMFPDSIYVVASLPMTSSSKVDRNRLLKDAGLAGPQPD